MKRRQVLRVNQGTAKKATGLDWQNNNFESASILFQALRL